MFLVQGQCFYSVFSGSSLSRLLQTTFCLKLQLECGRNVSTALNQQNVSHGCLCCDSDHLISLSEDMQMLFSAAQLWSHAFGRRRLWLTDDRRRQRLPISSTTGGQVCSASRINGSSSVLDAVLRLKYSSVSMNRVKCL